MLPRVSSRKSQTNRLYRRLNRQASSGLNSRVPSNRSLSFCPALNPPSRVKSSSPPLKLRSPNSMRPTTSFLAPSPTQSNLNKRTTSTESSKSSKSLGLSSNPPASPASGESRASSASLCRCKRVAISTRRFRSRDKCSPAQFSPPSIASSR